MTIIYDKLTNEIGCHDNLLLPRPTSLVYSWSKTQNLVSLSFHRFLISLLGLTAIPRIQSKILLLVYKPIKHIGPSLHHWIFLLSSWSPEVFWSWEHEETLWVLCRGFQTREQSSFVCSLGKWRTFSLFGGIFFSYSLNISAQIQLNRRMGPGLLQQPEWRKFGDSRRCKVPSHFPDALFQLTDDSK